MIKIKKLDYIDDLGGTITSNLHTLKHGLLYRSSHLSKLDEENIDKLFSRYPLKNIIDLRTVEEIKQAPEKEKLPTGVNYYHFPLADDKANPAVNKDNRLDILNELVKLEGGVKSHITKLYRIVATSEMAIASYKEIFQLLLNNKNNEAFDFHCTQGKDRTGILIILILYVLGVSLNMAINVYLSFNKYGVFRRIAIFLGMNLVVSPRKAVALNALLTAKRKYINAAIDEINQKFGSLDLYIKNIIGLTDEDIKKLRKQYVN